MSEVPPKKENIDHLKSVDVKATKEAVNSAYFDAADALRAAGTHPSDLKEWGEAATLHAAVQGMLAEYGKTTDIKRAEELERDIQANVEKLNGHLDDVYKLVSSDSAQPEALPSGEATDEGISEPQEADALIPAAQATRAEKWAAVHEGIARHEDAYQDSMQGMSENQKSMRESNTVNASHWGAPDSLPTWSESKKKLAGLIGELQSLKGKAVEKGKQAVGGASAYLVERRASTAEKLQKLWGGGKESAKTNAEKAKAYAKFLADRETTNAQRVESLWGKAKDLGNWYRKLPLKTKLVVAAGFAAASAGVSISGGASVLLTPILVSALAGRRILGGLAAYTALEGAIEKRMAAKEERTGQKRGRFASIGKHVGAGLAGVLVGEGFVGASLKWAFSESEQGIEYLVNHWPGHGDIVGTSGAGSFVEATSNPEAAGEAIGQHVPASSAPAGGAPGAAADTVSGEHAPVAVEGVSIDTRGEGAGQMFADLKEQLRAAGYSATNGSEDVKRIMGMRVQDLARYYGLDTMHMGDHLTIDEHGHAVFTPEGGEPRMLDHAVADHPSEPVAHPEHAAASHHASHGMVSDERRETAFLNNEQTTNPGVTHGAGWHYDPNAVSVEHHASAAPTSQSYPAPSPVETHSAPAVADAHPSADAATASEAQAPSIDSPSAIVNDITHSPLWGEYHGGSTWQVLKMSVSPGTPEAMLRGDIISLVKSSGVGPKLNESFGDYVSRANQLIATGAAAPSGVYEVQGHFIAHGGDLMARQTLALEYMVQHPGVQAVVENQNGFSIPQIQVGTGGNFISAPDGTFVAAAASISVPLDTGSFTHRVL